VAVKGFASALGIHEEDASDGRARLSFEAGERHMNPAGTLHGGVVAALADTAMASAVRSSTGEGEAPATSQMTIAFLHPGHAGRIIVRAEVRRRGDHLMLCEADIEQDGRTLAHAVATFAVVQR
jgi:uncharacterized protein (TIGR00369 family)